MEYLQYFFINNRTVNRYGVLNLVINGIPSILKTTLLVMRMQDLSFKPCYKWNTFNTTSLSASNFISLAF